MKLAIIGCGKIARLHAVCMQNAGFNISCVSGRQGKSKSVDDFADEFSVKNKFENSFDLINHPEWDALLITCPTKFALKYLKASADKKKPILVEKPITYDYRRLEEFLKYDNICVGLNRRFYKSVLFTKKFVINNDSILIRVNIPESVNDTDFDENFIIPKKSYENSIHMFDLLNFLSGSVSWINTHKIMNNENLKAIIATGKSDKNITIQICHYFNSSDNFSIDVTSDKKRVLLKPIEVAEFYEGMNIIEPNEKIRIRSYSPKLVERIYEESEFKPGFIDQSYSFMNFCNNIEDSRLAKITDIYRALKLIEELK